MHVNACCRVSFAFSAKGWRDASKSDEIVPLPLNHDDGIWKSRIWRNFLNSITATMRMPHCWPPHVYFHWINTKRNKLEEFMYNRKSVYTLNKEHPEAILYPDAMEKKVMLTSEQFANEEEFSFWKNGSDGNYTTSEKICRKQNRGKITRIVGYDEDASVDKMFTLAARL